MPTVHRGWGIHGTIGLEIVYKADVVEQSARIRKW